MLPAVPSLRLVQLAELGSVVTARFPLNCQPQKRARGCSLTVCERGSGCCRSPFLPRGCSCKQVMQRGARKASRQRRVGKGTPRCQQWRVQDGAEAHKSSARLQHPLWGRKDHPEASQPLPVWPDPDQSVSSPPHSGLNSSKMRNSYQRDQQPLVTKICWQIRRNRIPLVSSSAWISAADCSPFAGCVKRKMGRAGEIRKLPSKLNYRNAELIERQGNGL